MIPEKVKKEIERRLKELESKENARILFAVESGSRAWGFPSPDSDFDIRFVYVRHLDFYLSLTPGRDVITPTIDLPYDLEGWDIQKTLNLMQKNNAVIFEWLQSPIRYRWNEAFCGKITALAREANFYSSTVYHYLHLGQSNWKRCISDREHVRLKKYFYVLRPALALRWLRYNRDIFPPMNLAELRSGLKLDANLNHEIDRLLALKAKTKELGEGTRWPVLDEFIQQEFDLAEPGKGSTKNPALAEKAQVFFRETVLSK